MSFYPLEYLQESRNPKHVHEDLASISKPHVESFDSIFNQNLLDLAVLDIPPLTVFSSKDPETRKKMVIWLSNPIVGTPTLEGKGTMQTRLYPAECRERGITYKAKFQIKVNYTVDGITTSEIKSFGSLPIMVKSEKCNLKSMTPKQNIAKHEDPEEFGGYFIVNGIEKLIRLLIVPRRNISIGIIRPSFTNRGPTFTKYGVQTRCVREDQSSLTVSLHYCSDGEIMYRFSHLKNEYTVPALLILRALVQTTDEELFERITMGDHSNSFLTDRVEMLLRSFRKYSIYGQDDCLDYLGSKFGGMLNSPDDSTTTEIASEFLMRIVYVHLNDDKAKFDFFIFNIQKLYALVSGDCAQDNPDALQFQETLLPGHLFMGIIKEKLIEYLSALKAQIATDVRRTPTSVDFTSKKFLAKLFTKLHNVSDIGKKLEYFLATGNLVSKSGMDLQQASGYTIIAEKLNFYRYVAHFRSIHRGAFFAELKTTTVRKLLPESWGFLCPVHTPDGSPCGLLNHLSHTCEIVVSKVDVLEIPSLVASLGVSLMVGNVPYLPPKGTLLSKDNHGESTILSVQLDGKVIGWCDAKTALSVARVLRDWKVKGLHNVPLELEIGFVPPSKGGQYPGLFLFTSPARMIRPTKYLITGTKDYVGPFEQPYMDIACMPEDIVPGLTTHQEFKPTDMLSVVASLTPFSDFNQSPRNMYQCQMGKQTMGTPVQNFPHRTDNKMYRLQTGQTPVVRPKAHDKYGLDGYPNGMNAVVCVISYTGYDMEDASILQKGSFERGYGYGTVYKGDWIDLGDHRRKGEPISHFFGFFVEGQDEPCIGPVQLAAALEFLDWDGLPMVGIKLTNGDPYYAYVDEVTEKVKIVRYKGMEDAYVDQVRVLGTESADQPLQKIQIKLRIPRPPIIGDKFSSRHGQKGVISQKWPSVDMPFSETGIIPDVIINPHAFPSRMTIGMFIESLAGKAGSLHGISQDSTPFKFNEDHAAADYFGEQLKAAGFNYHGNEPMYSGITGEEFKCDIYIGVLYFNEIVYYQRLRHMVSDKYQVRTVGPVHNLTQQPVKGRKRAGGIRLGEMERDSLLAHGISFTLQDRLMNCSDYSQCHVCKKCGSILSPMQIPINEALLPSRGQRIICKTCNSAEQIDIIAIPYVFRYLATELVAMNVKLTLAIK